MFKHMAEACACDRVRGLELAKSCYLLMTWQLKNGTEELSSIQYEPGSLNLRSDKYTGLDLELRRNSVNDAERLLGARLALDGGGEAEYAYRLDQAKVLAGKVVSLPFSRFDNEFIYRKRWISSVGYFLPITQFTNAQCDEIQKPIYNAMLPKMGFNRHFPRAVIFGPLKYQGKQLADYKKSVHEPPGAFRRVLEAGQGHMQPATYTDGSITAYHRLRQTLFGTLEHYLPLRGEV